MKTLLKSCGLSLLLATGIVRAEAPTDSPYYRAGNLVFISGQVAVNPITGKIVSDKLEEQVDQIFKNLKATAEKAGGSLQNIVKLNVYMSDLESTFPLVKKAIAKYFKPPYPARTPVGGIKFGPGRLLEIDAVMALQSVK